MAGRRPAGRDSLSDNSAVAVSVVQVWIVRMAVPERLVAVRVGMRF